MTVANAVTVETAVIAETEVIAETAEVARILATESQSNQDHKKGPVRIRSHRQLFRPKSV